MAWRKTTWALALLTLLLLAACNTLDVLNPKGEDPGISGDADPINAASGGRPSAPNASGAPPIGEGPGAAGGTSSDGSNPGGAGGGAAPPAAGGAADNGNDLGAGGAGGTAAAAGGAAAPGDSTETADDMADPTALDASTPDAGLDAGAAEL